MKASETLSGDDVVRVSPVEAKRDCIFFYEKLQWGAGTIKNYLTAASRAYLYVTDATSTPAHDRT